MFIRLGSKPRIPALPRRSVATIPSSSTAPASSPPKSTVSDEPPPAIAFSRPRSSQPFSTPLSPQIHSNTTDVEELPRGGRPVHVKGSIPGGMELKGIAYMKTKPSVFAKEDDEYPPWLWTLLDKANVGEDKASLSLMTKKQRAKYDRKQERLQKNLPKQIPIHEQSMDLTRPDDNAFLSLRRRQDITKSSRAARRKAIREKNFLKAL